MEVNSELLKKLVAQAMKTASLELAKSLQDKANNILIQEAGSVVESKTLLVAADICLSYDCDARAEDTIMQIFEEAHRGPITE